VMRDTVGLGSPVMRAMSWLPRITEPWLNARSTSSPRASASTNFRSFSPVPRASRTSAAIAAFLAATALGLAPAGVDLGAAAFGAGVADFVFLAVLIKIVVLGCRQCTLLAWLKWLLSNFMGCKTTLLRQFIPISDSIPRR